MGVVRRKKISRQERKFALLIAEGLSSLEAARKVFGWKCEPHTKEQQKAKDLRRTPRVKEELARIKDQMSKESEATQVVASSGKIDIDSMREFLCSRLEDIRDDPTVIGRSRFHAIKALEQLADPAKDINLIWRYIDIIWKNYTAHCPCCHEDFPLWKVNNNKLNTYRQVHEVTDVTPNEDLLERRLAIIKEGERRKVPHARQLYALASPERHMVGKGAARAGKSFLLGMFALLYFLTPGVEVWLLAQAYSDARSEMEYLEDFLKTMFYPVYPHMVTKHEDSRTKEISLVSLWGSEIRVKSGRSKASITGRELEAALVAEPAWVDESLFEEVRARMSSRLGRIISLGTPKGYGGFLNRMIKMSGRDGKSGRRMKDEERTVAGGCPWNKSMLVFNISPEDNPEYVVSELEAARGELTEEEYAAEFRGEMVAGEGHKFPFIKEEHLSVFTRDQLSNCSFALGIDQGEKNFAGCLIGYDGHNIYVVDEYFDNDTNTIKANMVELNRTVPPLVSLIGGHSSNWKLTIFDADPPVQNTLLELEDENREWGSDITFRPKNIKDLMNWREETYQFINQMAFEGRLLFCDDRAYMLHEQMQEALIKPPIEGKESTAGTTKGWIIRDPFRGDHVPDAFVLAMWTVLCKAIDLPEQYNPEKKDTWLEARMGQDYARAKKEDEELRGWDIPKPPGQDAFEEHFGRKQTGFNDFVGWYPDES